MHGPASFLLFSGTLPQFPLVIFLWVSPCWGRGGDRGERLKYPGAVDPQLRIILQWLIASEAEVAELYFQDSAKKEFILLSKQLQEKGWKVGDVLQAVLKYYEVVEKPSREERCKSLFDWLLENAQNRLQTSMLV